MFFLRSLPGLILMGFIAGVLVTLLFIRWPWIGGAVAIAVVLFLLLLYFAFKNFSM